MTIFIMFIILSTLAVEDKPPISLVQGLFRQVQKCHTKNHNFFLSSQTHLQFSNLHSICIKLFRPITTTTTTTTIDYIIRPVIIIPRKLRSTM